MTALDAAPRLGKASGGGWRPNWPPPGARYTSGKRRGRTPRAVRVGAAVGAVDAEANLRFSPVDGAYGALPAWRNRTHYVAALPWHPRLHPVCKAHGVRVELFLTAMTLEAARADHDTGRGIAVAHDALAHLLGCSVRHVRNIKRVARDLGVQQVVLAGAQMTGTQRWQVLDAYKRGHHSRTWRGLPNISAATVPAELVSALHRPLRDLRRRLDAAEHAAHMANSRWHHARLFRTGERADRRGRRGDQLRTARFEPPVDNSPLFHPVQQGFFRLPRRGSRALGQHLTPYEKPLFQPGCGQTPNQLAAEQQRTAAARPTGKHQRAGSATRRRLDPALKAYAAAFRARLPRSRLYPDPWSRVQLARLAQGLNRHRLAGLTPAELVAGIGTYLRSTDRGWMLDWEPGQETDQAQYIGGLLRDAAAAGELFPFPDAGMND